MNIFYNRDHVGDVLLVSIDATAEGEPVIERKGDVVVIRVQDDIVGVNIFNASATFSIQSKGIVEVTAALVEQIEDTMKEAGFDYTFDVDLSPKFVVGHVVSKEKHPNADKLSVCQVDVGDETLQIVCGAANVDAGQRVVVAKVGAVMPSGLVIRDAALRGVDSTGMICSAKELDLPNGEQQSGILVLEDDRTIGEDFFAQA